MNISDIRQKLHPAEAEALLPSLTDDQICAMFLANYRHSAHTLRNYERAIRQFRSFIGNKRLRDATWRDLEAYKSGLTNGSCSLSGKPQAAATIASLLAPLRSLYAWGSDQNIALFPINPTTSVKAPKINVTSENHYLTREEVILLLTALKRQSYRNYLIGLSLVMLGLRVSELMHAQWKDFHTDPAGNSMWLTVTQGKGGKRREVKVPTTLWALYEEYQQGLLKSGRLEMKVFTISIRQVELMVQKARAQSGLAKNVTPHWLRHTNATLALLHGASLQQVQKTLGHVQINTTQRYMHTVEQLQKSAPDYVEECLQTIFHSNPT